MVANNLREWSLWLFAIWLAIIVYVMGKPPNTPPSAPSGCGIINGAPVYAYPEVSYDDRYSPACLGPPIDDLTPVGGLPCPIAFAAVTAQGVGE